MNANGDTPERPSGLPEWIDGLAVDISRMPAGSTIMVTTGEPPGPRWVVTVLRYLDSALSLRLTHAAGSGEFDAVSEGALTDQGWIALEEPGSTGPERWVRFVIPDVPRNEGVDAGQAAAAAVEALVSVRPGVTTADLRRGPADEDVQQVRWPQGSEMKISSYGELEVVTKFTISKLDAPEALSRGNRLVTAAAHGAVTVRIDEESPVLYIEADLVEGMSHFNAATYGNLVFTGFGYEWEGGTLSIGAELTAAPFSPAHLEIVLMVAEDLAFSQAQRLAELNGGRSLVGTP